MHNNTNVQRGDDSVTTANEPLEAVDRKHVSSRWSDDTLHPTNSSSSPSKRDRASSTGTRSSATTNGAVRSTREKVRHIGHEAKIKTKRLLRRSHAKTEKEVQTKLDEHDDLYQDIQDDPAFEPAQLINHKRWDAEAVADRTLDTIVAGVKAIAHPGNAAKRKAASKVAVEDKPYISREADLQFLEAHENLDKAKLQGEACSGDADEIEHRADIIRNLEELRESRKVAWTTSHQIRRVLVIPKREITAPRKTDFYVRDDRSGKQTLDWRSWLSALNKHALQNFANNSMGHVDFASQPPFDRDVMTRQIERLLIASAPWQSWFSSLRQIYRWEDPSKTRKWFAVWFVVWYLDYVVTFSLAYIAFVVLENKYRSRNVAQLRESYNRTRDRGAAAYKFNELTSKHGSDKWLDPVVEELGPKLQSQLTDLASLLEVLNNFYEWRVPIKTWATLFWFFCAILLGTLTSTQHSMKIIWMFTILDFFLGFWVASHYPQYRHVVRSLEWIFWDIPDDGEWSMMYLRTKAQATRARLIEDQVQKRHETDLRRAGTTTPSEGEDVSSTGDSKLREESYGESDTDGDSFATADSSTGILCELNILSFRCHTHGLRGQLIIFSDGLRFVRMGSQRWRRLWTELLEIQKVESSLAPGLPKAVGLQFVFTDGSEVTLDNVKERDRAFNCIIGFSGLLFQVTQPAADGKCHSTVMDMKSGHPKDGTLWPKNKKDGTG